MARLVTNYQCPSCTGPLRFDGPSGKLVCDYCGSRFDTAEIEQLYSEKDTDARKNYIQQENSKTESQWDTSLLSDEWGEDGEKMKYYSCPSCGAQLICDESTSATHCPYCNNPSIVPGQFAGTLKPEYIIPFRLSHDDAVKALQQYYQGKKFLPDVFTKNNRIQEIQGVYVPFWLFSGKAEADVTYTASNTRVFRQGEYQVTETTYFDVRRKGTVPFAKIPVDASSRMPDKYMDSVEPFDYSELKPFSTGYLPGFLAQRHDVPAEECAPRADSRAENTAVDIMSDKVTGYDSYTVNSKNIVLKRGKVSYALLPVYMLNTTWNNQDYLFAMNGQTGKFIGNLPVDKAKYHRSFFGIFAAVTALLGTALMLLF